VLGEGIQYDHTEFGGRAFDGGFNLKHGQCSSARFGTIIASLAAGNTVGVAKKANVYRYFIKYCSAYLKYAVTIQYSEMLQ